MNTLFDLGKASTETKGIYVAGALDSAPVTCPDGQTQVQVRKTQSSGVTPLCP